MTLTLIVSSYCKNMKRDESFTNDFTLSTFRKDMPIAAASNFELEYAITKRILGPHCKLLEY